MRQATIQVEITEENGCLTLIFSGLHGEKYREIVPFSTQAARRANKYLHHTLLTILQEYQPAGTIEGSVVHEEE